MFLFGIMGLIMVNIYNVWAWNIGLIVTIIGWALLVKSAFYFLMPGTVIKKLLKIKKQLSVLYAGGIIGIVLGCVLVYYSYFTKL